MVLLTFLQTVFRWLQELGYRGFFIDQAGARDIREFDPEVHQRDNSDPAYVNNFLFLPADRVPG